MRAWAFLTMAVALCVAAAPALSMTIKGDTLKNGTRVPYTWKFPSYGSKLLVLRGAARIDRVSTSRGIIEQGELTVTGPGYSTTETFLQTASGGTGKFTKIFSHGGRRLPTTVLSLGSAPLPAAMFS